MQMMLKNSGTIRKHYLKDTNQSAYLACQIFEVFKRRGNMPVKKFILFSFKSYIQKSNIMISP